MIRESTGIDKSCEMLGKIFGCLHVGDDFRIRTNDDLNQLYKDVNLVERMNF